MTDITRQRNLEKARARRSSLAETRNLELAAAIEKTGQPLTVNEVRVLNKKLTGRLVDQSAIRARLARMVQTGLLVTRPETDEERILRGGGQTARGTAGMYFVAASRPKARRTVEIAVDGHRFDHASSRRLHRPLKNAGLPRAKKVQTGSVDEIIARQIAELQARIDELQKLQTGIKNS